MTGSVTKKRNVIQRRVMPERAGEHGEQKPGAPGAGARNVLIYELKNASVCSSDSCYAMDYLIKKPIVTVKPTVIVTKMDNSISVLTRTFFFLNVASFTIFPYSVTRTLRVFMIKAHRRSRRLPALLAIRADSAPG